MANMQFGANHLSISGGVIIGERHAREEREEDLRLADHRERIILALLVRRYRYIPAIGGDQGVSVAIKRLLFLVRAPRTLQMRGSRQADRR